ncbi:hypothetical protein OIU34_37865 [Pararhizobium sp. BT-229]|uniref:hypothetical protein n=1 Tax=Pararhizobium sp. BT-229 TaxID=2986923 RepID=UPI0021F759BB|nr:hypothetical protein [Pararhizobium sp. BT-229]MCV9967596.1 hypothetical protein [Pararhizobium sp. BT-229]
MKQRTSKRLAIAFLLWPVFVALVIIVPFYTVYFGLGQSALERIFAEQTFNMTIFLRAAGIIEFCLWAATVQYLFNLASSRLRNFTPWHFETMRNQLPSFILWDELKEDQSKGF